MFERIFRLETVHRELVGCFGVAAKEIQTNVMSISLFLVFV
jgi:hypothetical protein